MFRLLNNLVSFLDPLINVTVCGPKVIRLGVIDLDVEERAPLATRG